MAEVKQKPKINKQEYLRIIRASIAGEQLTAEEQEKLFYWARHQDSVEFDFVPKEYKIRRGNN